MKKSSLVASFFALTTLVAGFVARNATEKAAYWEKEATFGARQLAIIREDRDRLAGILDAQKREEREARNRRYCIELEEQTAAIRKLSFLKPVTYRRFESSDIPAILKRKISEKMPEKRLTHYFKGLGLLGLLPQDYSLDDYAALLEEQILAFYDDHEKVVYLAANIDLGSTFNRMVLAHELTHALQDQHFDLSKFLTPLGEDDQQIALMSLVEGDAMVTMNDWLAHFGAKEGTSELLLRSMMQNYDKLLAAPSYVRNSLLFPYVRGAAFFQQRALEPEQRDEIFRNPPSSTFEIFHPHAPAAPPARFEWDLAQLSEKPASRNAVGILGLQSLLENEESAILESLPFEWAGDHYLYFQETPSLIWRTRWKNKEAADSFEKILGPALEKRFAKTRKPAGQTIHEVIRFSPLEVVFISAPSPERVTELKGLLKSP